MRVLSLFDGISAGQLALQRAGIRVDRYLASEVDEAAIAITARNFPGTIQIGDIRGVKPEDVGDVDLLIGGPPCQDLSTMNMNRSGLAGDRSCLFFTFADLVKKIRPRFFLMENIVSMGPETRSIISHHLGVDPIKINGSIVSAQSRNRYYWSNFNWKRPAEKDIRLIDILQQPGYTERDKAFAIRAAPSAQAAIRKSFKSGPMETYFRRSQNQIVWRNRACYEVGRALVSGNEINRRVYSPIGISPSILTGNHGRTTPKIYWKQGLWRDLTLTERLRCFNFPENYFDGQDFSKTALGRCIGNSWVVDLVAAMFRGMESDGGQPIQVVLPL